MFTLSSCPACGALHDDGGFYVIDGRGIFLCMDCADGLPADKAERKDVLRALMHSWEPSDDGEPLR